MGAPALEEPAQTGLKSPCWPLPFRWAEAGVGPGEDMFPRAAGMDQRCEFDDEWSEDSESIGQGAELDR